MIHSLKKGIISIEGEKIAPITLGSEVILENGKTLQNSINDGDFNSQSSGTSSSLTEEQINNINLIPNIESKVNSNTNKINSVYTKGEIDNKILDIQSGAITLKEIEEDCIVFKPEEDEIFGEIIVSSDNIYTLDTSIASVGFKLSIPPIIGQTVNIESSNEEIVLNKNTLYFDENNYKEYQFIDISINDNSLNNGNRIGYIKAYNNNLNTVYVSVNAKTKNTVETPIEVTELTINSMVKDLEIGERRPLNYTILPKNASDKFVTFTSSNDTIATVDMCGIITGVSEGEVTITVTTNSGNIQQLYTVNVVSNRIETENLNISYDLTKYSDGYSGQVEDLSGNNIVPNITGLDLHTTGRCGFIGNKLMLNGTECKFEIPNNEYILKHPQTIEIYGKFRSAYNGSIENDNLSLGSLTNANYTLINSRINPIDNGYWLRYFPNKGDCYLYIVGSLGDCTVYKDFKISSASKIYNEDIHLVFEFGKAEQKIYLNGNCIYYGTKSVSDFTDATTKTLRLCSENGIGLDLKHFRLYSDMLDVETIRRNYNFIKEGEK